MREDFERDRALKFRVVGAIDFAHGPGANGRDDFVLADAAAGKKMHAGAGIIALEDNLACGLRQRDAVNDPAYVLCTMYI